MTAHPDPIQVQAVDIWGDDRHSWRFRVADQRARMNTQTTELAQQIDEAWSISRFLINVQVNEALFFKN